jgi:hypothetical protein
LAGATIDHLVSVTIFLAAMLLFISFFNQTIQTAVIYQQHNALATKCSDLLDNMLLTPRIPVDAQPTIFGLHEIDFAGYTLDPFSLMRLNSSIGTPVPYEKTDITYSNTPVDFGNSLLMPINDPINPLNNVVNYSSALEMLGISGAYGFQLTLTPVITFNIEAQRSDATVEMLIDVRGISFPLTNALVSYYFLPVSLNGDYPAFLTEEIQTGTVSTNEAGIATRSFDLAGGLTYVFLAYAHVSGLAGVGFYAPDSSGSQQLILFVESLSENTVLLAHGADVPNTASSSGELNYTSAFVKLSNENFELQDNATGEVWSGASHNPQVIAVPSYAGILVVAYRDDSGTGGVAVMPWGVGSLAFPVTFGGDPAGQEWVATDMRQVLIGGVAYQAKLSLWSLQGVQVVG